MTDVVQNSRLDQLERTIRELSGELIAERKALNQLAGDQKRDAGAHFESAGRYSDNTDERRVVLNIIRVFRLHLAIR